MIIREISNEEKELYNSLSTHICQSWEWGSFRIKTNSVPQITRLGVFDGKTLLRTYQIFFHKAPYINRLIAYCPRPINLVEDDVAAIKTLCTKMAVTHLKIEPQQQPPESLGLIKGASILPTHSLILNISEPIETVLEKMHEKTRYNIKVAQKNQIRVTNEESEEALEDFIKLYDATQKRQGFTAKSGDYLRTLWDCLRPSKMVYLLNAYLPNEAKPLAGIMLFKFKDTLYFPYGGWSSEHREMMPNNLLHFEAIKLGQSLGCKSYDFWSSYKNKPDQSDPWYGTYMFKKGFGGEEVHYPGAFDLPLDSMIYKVITFIDPWRIKLAKLKKQIV